MPPEGCPSIASWYFLHLITHRIDRYHEAITEAEGCLLERMVRYGNHTELRTDEGEQLSSLIWYHMSLSRRLNRERFWYGSSQPISQHSKHALYEKRYGCPMLPIFLYGYIFYHVK